MSQQIITLLQQMSAKTGAKLRITKNTGRFKLDGKEIEIKISPKSRSITHDCNEEFLRRNNIYWDFASLNAILPL